MSNKLEVPDKGGLVLTLKHGDAISIEHGLLFIVLQQTKGRAAKLRFVSSDGSNVKIDRVKAFNELVERGVDPYTFRSRDREVE
jgi:hypothetical protein